MTWDSGFTLAVSGVLTNTYVQGMIGSKVTLGANVGYGDEVGFQLYGISDVIEVADIPSSVPVCCSISPIPMIPVGSIR